MKCASFVHLKDEEKDLKYCGIHSHIVIYYVGQQLIKDQRF